MISHKLRAAVATTFDPYFDRTTLLVTGDGTNGAQNNTFIDGSSNAFTITSAANPAQGSQSPYTQTFPYSPNNGASGGFDGSTTYLTVPDNVAFTMGSGNFTVECWAYATSTTGTSYILGQIDSAFTTTSASFFIQISAGSLVGYVASGSTFYGAFGTISTNVWTHIAFVRQGTTLRLYVNGVQVGTNTSISTLAINDSTQVLAVGRIGARTVEYFSGFLSDVRIVKGTAVYLNGTTFTPPTIPLTAISGTSLLCNFKNAGIYDSAATVDLRTLDNVQISTAVKKYGTGSISFDGNLDRLLSLSANTGIDLLPNSFTIEGWFYTTSTKAGGQRLIATGGGFVGWNSTNGVHINLSMAGGSVNNYLYCQLSTNTASPVQVIGPSLPAINTWFYVAVVYDAPTGKLRLFKDGVMSEATVSGVARPSTAPSLGIGSIPGEGGGSTTAFQGYMDDIRITKGIARYSANFTPPTVALPTQ